MALLPLEISLGGSLPLHSRLSHRLRLLQVQHHPHRPHHDSCPERLQRRMALVPLDSPLLPRMCNIPQQWSGNLNHSKLGLSLLLGAGGQNIIILGKAT